MTHMKKVGVASLKENISSVNGGPFLWLSDPSGNTAPLSAKIVAKQCHDKQLLAFFGFDLLLPLFC